MNYVHISTETWELRDFLCESSSPHPEWPARPDGYLLRAGKTSYIVNIIHAARDPQKHTDGLKREGTPRHVNHIHTPQTAYGNRTESYCGRGTSGA